MAYELIGFLNDNPPAINAANLNKMDNQIYVNDGNIQVVGKDGMDSYESKEMFNLFSFDDENFVKGKGYSGATFTIVDASNYCITGFIPVFSGETMSIQTQNSQSYFKCAIYDVTKNGKRVIISETNPTDWNIVFNENALVRIQFGTNNINNLIINTSKKKITDNALNIDATSTIFQAKGIFGDLVNVSNMDRLNYLHGKGFSQYTNVIANNSPSDITGYIPIKKGLIVNALLDDSNFFDYELSFNFRKFAIYDNLKNWIGTYPINAENNPNKNYLPIMDGYIRFMFPNAYVFSVFNNFRNVKTDMLDDNWFDLNNQLEALLSDDKINYSKYDPENYLVNKGFSGNTGNIVDSTGDDVTGYIPVKKGDKIYAYVNTYNIFTSTEDLGNRKFAVYDSEKNWKSTLNLRSTQYSQEYYTMQYDGYVRIMYKNSYILDVNINNYKKIDGNNVTGSVGEKYVDAIIFMGQSNMAGRGIVTEEHPQDAPAVIDGAGWEFRAVTDPTKLYPITKIFGKTENNVNGINDGGSKTGGVLPSFANAYYTYGGKVPFVGVSASEGASSISTWIPDGDNLEDALNRWATCINWLSANHYQIRHKYMVWCQGEADANQTEEWYTEKFNSMFNAMKLVGVEKCFIIRIGNNNPVSQGKINMMTYQNHICQNNPDVIMVSTDFASMLSRNMMKDAEHYFQDGYNECGDFAGKNTAFYVMTGKEPTMYDPQFDNLYYSHIN